MARKRTQKVVLNMTFDKPVTKEEALAAAKDNIHGTFYPIPEKTGGAGSFTVRSFTPYRES